MESILYVILGMFIGGLIVWFLAKARFQGVYAEQLTELEGKAKGAEALVNELRQQVQHRESELGQMRNELGSEKQLKVEALTRLEESQKNLDEQKTLLEAMKTEMTDTFNALSSAALKSSSEDFLRLASEHLGKVVAETKGKLGEHQAAINGLVKPLQEALRRYEEQVHGIEVKRKQDYTSLDEQIKMLSSIHQQLQKETGNLVTALRKPHVRGRWGEITLRNVVELAGMSVHCDFTEQPTVESESGRLRPDMVIHLPGGRGIVVDSKVSMEALLETVSAASEEAKREALKRHAYHVNEQINRLSSKAYWSQFSKSPELVVLFLGESALVSALEADPTMMEDSMSKKVLIATPTTLFALLTAVAYGWRQEQVTRNAEVIGALGKELYERITVWAKHVNEIGTALGRAMESFNKSVGSIESRVLPSVRKFKELGVAGAEEIPILEQVDKTPRSLGLLDTGSNEDENNQ